MLSYQVFNRRSPKVSGGRRPLARQPPSLSCRDIAMINARPRRRSRLLLLVSLLVTVLGLVAAGPASATQRPTSIPLPNGFSPEDITNGRGSTFYVGSLAAGGIYQGDFRTGQGHLLVTSADGPTTGLFLERRAGQHDRLWAAGGPSGEARVYDAGTGALLRTYRLAAPGSGSFISDMAVTDRAAYYTDSFVQQMYVIPLGRNGGLSAPSAARAVPLTGAVTYQPAATTFNLNGIALVDGTLVMGQTVTGKLFAVNPSTGRAREIPLVDRTGQPV